MTTTTTVFTAIGAFILGGLVAFGADHYVLKSKDQRDNMETIGGFQGWRLTCPARSVKTGNCLLQQALGHKGSNQILAELNIAPDKDKKDVLTVVAPLGVFVLPGIKIAVGNSPEKSVPYRTCLQMGCIAALPLDAGLADAMAHNANLQVTVVAAGKPLPLTFPLAGYSDAVAARAADMAARNP